MKRFPIRDKRSLSLLLTLVALAVGTSASVVEAQNVSGYAMIPEPLLFLLREPAVHRDLQLTDSQKRNLERLNHTFDSQLLASRNRRPEEAQRMSDEALKKTREAIERILTEQQRERIQQITYRLRGMSFVIMPKAAEALELTEQQRTEIQELVQQTREKIRAATSGTYPGPDAHAKRRQTVTDAQRAEQDGIVAALTDSQKRRVNELVGERFDTSLLGEVSFKAPELSDGDIWINSKSLKLDQLKGKVVAVHFWAFGCINCIHNYPWYKEWESKYEGEEDFVMIGIHTPETNVERDVDSVREKVKKAGFGFPVVVDNEKSNWNNWGNSMWPAVYLIDKQGRIRYWWYGELNWNGAGGQRIMGDRIQQLLREEV